MLGNQDILGFLQLPVRRAGQDFFFLLLFADGQHGGLLTNTVLSLLVIPVVFTYLDDLGQWAGRICGRGMR